MAIDDPFTLSVQRLTIELGEVTPVRDLSFEIPPGRCLALVGESGCGKTLTALALMGLLPGSARVRGRLELQGEPLLGQDERVLGQWRGSRLAMIFQEPLSALNPVVKVGAQIAEMFIIHSRATRREAWRRAVALLEEVRVSDPARRAHAYPHQLSGGMRQRVMIAMAIALEPALLIADEPTTALDVTVQGEILDLIARLGHERAMSVLLISHNLAVVARTADEIAVMYRGALVERAPTHALGAAPAHPYSALLLDSVPVIGQRGALEPTPRPDSERQAGAAIEDADPDRPTSQGGGPKARRTAGAPPPVEASIRHQGCAYAPRCPRASDRCRSKAPSARPRHDHGQVACWHPREGAGTPSPSSRTVEPR